MRVALQELDLATMRGELVSRTSIEAVLAPKIIAAAEHMRSIPDRSAAILAVERSADTIHRMLSDEFARGLAMLAVDFEPQTLRRSS